MLNKEQAFELATNYIEKRFGPEFGTDREWMKDEGDLFVTASNTKKYIQTGNIFHNAVGAGALIIDKENSMICLYGSAMSPKEAIEDYRKQKVKWEQVKLDYPHFIFGTPKSISIQKILDHKKLMSLILSMEFEYLIPIIEGDTIYRNRLIYDHKVLIERLKTLPCQFTNIEASFVLNFYIKNKERNACVFTLEEYLEVKRTWKLSEATEKDLETEW